MPDVRAEITVREARDLNWFERKILGWAWWWQVQMPYSSRHSLARTKEKAQVKAEAAARKMAAEDSAPFERYTYEVADDDGA